MNYTTFANSNRKVSKLAFGAMGLNCAFGNYDEGDLIKSIHHCLDQGINIIDTARAYLDSERILGRALKQWRGEQPFIASKAIPSSAKGNLGWGIPNPVDVAYPKGSVRKSVEESLLNLGVDCIDLMQLHQFWGNFYGCGSWLAELEELKSEGKIKYIGISIVDHRHDGALEIVKSGSIDAVQTIINIFDPLAFDSLLPATIENKVAVIARCVLDEGGLSGFLDEHSTFEEGDFRADYFEHGPREEYSKRVKALERFVPQYADSLAELAIRYVLSHPGVTTACISMHIPQFADENIKAARKGALPDQVFEQIRRHDRWLHNLYEAKYFPVGEENARQTTAGSFKRRD